MRKKIVLPLILLILVFVGIKMGCPDMSKYIDAKVYGIKVQNLNEMDPPYDVIFKYYNWSNELKNQIDQNTDDYVVVNIGYSLKNQSDQISIEGLEFYPVIEKEYKDYILEFNSDNGNHYINCSPNEETGMNQTLIVKRNGKTNEQIRKMIMELHVEMIYFTGGLKTNTGQGYAGIGKHKFNFIIKDKIGRADVQNAQGRANGTRANGDACKWGRA